MVSARRFDVNFRVPAVFLHLCQLSPLIKTLSHPKGGSQKATLVVLVVVVVVRSATKLYVHICAHIPYRSIVSDFQLT